MDVLVLVSGVLVHLMVCERLPAHAHVWQCACMCLLVCHMMSCGNL